jgi:antitoxin component YwqK of YwqJK toxin-antitoxin module
MKNIVLLGILGFFIACNAPQNQQNNSTNEVPPARKIELGIQEQVRDSKSEGTREVVKYSNTGKPSRRFTEVDGVIEGRMEEYFPDGKIKYIRNFAKGQQHGITIGYYPTGERRQSQTFVHGLQEGNDSTFMRNGALQMTIAFKNGKKNGTTTRWSPEGKKIFEAEFADDKLVSTKKVQ